MLFLTEQPTQPGQSIVRPLPILGAALALGVLFDYLIFNHVPGLGFSLYVMAIVLVVIFLSRSFHKPLTREAKWFAALAVLFAAFITIRASYELSFMNAVLALFFLLLVVSETIGNRVRNFMLERYATLAWLPLYFLGNIAAFFATLLTGRKNGEHQTSRAVLRGVLLALPVLVVFALLFSSADLVFQKYAKSIIDLNISPETLVRIFLVFIISLVFCGAFWFALTKKNGGTNVDTEAGQGRPLGIGLTEVRILLGSINLLFLLFIVVQLTYLFGGQQGIEKQGFTYAEYARRGFFELIVVGVISWLIVWTLDRGFARGEARIQKSSKLFSGILVLQVFVIMASAFMRLVLYEQAYGFTTLRFYSHTFIIWLAVIFILLLYKLFANQRENVLAFSVIISIASLALLANVFNPDAFIAKQNMRRFAQTGKVDIFYLDELSADAVNTILSLLTNQNDNVAKVTANRLYYKRESLHNTQTSWQAFNVSRISALTLLDGKSEILKKNKDVRPDLGNQGQQSTVTD